MGDACHTSSRLEGTRDVKNRLLFLMNPVALKSSQEPFPVIFLCVVHPKSPNHILRYKRDHLLRPAAKSSDIEEEYCLWYPWENHEKRRPSACSLLCLFRLPVLYV